MLIILDRDGVINVDSPDYIKSPEEWVPIPGSIEAIAKLSKKYSVVIATNQSGINRGLFSLDTLNKIHEKMIMQINAAGGKLKAIYFCPHTPAENCECRKPKPGMLLQIQQDFNVKNTDMIYVGDSVKDYEVAQKIGCKFVLVRTGNGLKTLETVQNINVYDDLLAAAQNELL